MEIDQRLSRFLLGIDFRIFVVAKMHVSAWRMSYMVFFSSIYGNCDVMPSSLHSVPWYKYIFIYIYMYVYLINR